MKKFTVLLVALLALVSVAGCGANATKYESTNVSATIHLFHSNSTTYFKNIGVISELVLTNVFEEDEGKFDASGYAIYRYEMNVKDKSVDEVFAERKKAIEEKVEALNRAELDTDKKSKYDEGFRLLQLAHVKHVSETVDGVAKHYVESKITFENLSHVNTNYRIRTLDEYRKTSGVKEFLNDFTDVSGRVTSIVHVEDNGKLLVLHLDPGGSSSYYVPNIPITFKGQKIIAAHGADTEEIVFKGKTVSFSGSELNPGKTSEVAVLFTAATFGAVMSSDYGWAIPVAAGILGVGLAAVIVAKTAARKKSSK